MQGQDDGLLLVVLQQLLQVLHGLFDLLLPRLEQQDVVPGLEEVGGVGQEETGMALLADHRETAAGNGDDRGMVQKGRDLPGFQGGAHDHHALAAALVIAAVQVFLDQADQHFLVQVPFVDLVQDQHVVVALALDLLDHLHAVGQVQQGCLRRLVAVQSGLEADLTPPMDVASVGQVVGNGAGGDAPRLGDMDLDSGLPQPAGNAGRFAGSRFPPSGPAPDWRRFRLRSAGGSRRPANGH